MADTVMAYIVMTVQYAGTVPKYMYAQHRAAQQPKQPDAFGMSSHGLYSNGLDIHGPCSHGLYGHGLYCHGLCSHCRYGYGLYSDGLKILATARRLATA